MISVRDTLFGDLPLDQWPAGEATGAPWTEFVAAREALAAGHVEAATAHWQKVLATPDLESRHYLQAWHFLRAQGFHPNETTAKALLGVVIEVALPEGLDLLAAYAEQTARYYNFSGAAIVWERPDDSLDVAIDSLLAAGSEVVVRIGPWDRDRPSSPPAGHVRLNFLTPSGLHYGQAPMEALAQDELGGPVLQLGAELMQALIAKTPRPPAA